MKKPTPADTLIETVRWPQQEHLTFHGRNGTALCTGLDLFMHRGIVDLQPYTSRGQLGNCHIEIPLTALPQIIAALKRIRTVDVKHV